MNFASHKITGLKLPSGYDPNNIWRDLSQMKERDVCNYTGKPEDIAMCYFKFKIGYSEKWMVEQPFEYPIRMSLCTENFMMLTYNRKKVWSKILEAPFPKRNTQNRSLGYPTIVF